jgi:hypothetical protein
MENAIIVSSRKRNNKKIQGNFGTIQNMSIK